MKTEYVPPFHPTPFIVALVLVILLACRFAPAQEVSAPLPTIDTSKLFITEAQMDSFTITTYRTLMVGTWFVMGNIDKDAKGFKYAPTEVRVVVKNEPIVTAKDNGTWEITFKERAP